MLRPMRPTSPLRRPVLASLLLLSLLLGSCGEPAPAGGILERIRARGALVVATEAEFPPFESVEGGQIVGFDVDLVRAVADDLGVRLELRNVSFKSIIDELTSGKVDLIASGMTVTDERARTVLFSDVYFTTITCLLVSTARRGDVRSVEDLDRPDRTVAVKEGTTGEVAAKKRLTKARIVSHEAENTAAMDVAEGRADAFLYDLSSVTQHQQRNPERTFLIEAPVTHEPYAMACRLSDTALKQRVDAVLARLRTEGRLAALLAKHGLREPGSPR